MPIRPANPGADLSYAEFLQPTDSEVETMVLKVKPLADTQFRVEMFDRRLGSAISTDQAHIEMAIISAPFALLVPCGCFPGRWEVQETIPKNPFSTSQQ